MKKKKFGIIWVILIIILLIFVLDYAGVGSTKNQVVFNVPVGSNPLEIASILKENDLINSKILFTAYSVLTGKEYHAGEHKSNGGGYDKIAEDLVRTTAPKSVRVTIKEGMELHEIAEMLEEKGIVSQKDFYAAANLKEYDYWFLQDLPKRDNPLEGYLFPDTYDFTSEEGAKSIINKILKNFDSKITDARKKKIESSKYTLDEIIIMASIVEREAAVKEEFPLVAGVFYNRIDGVGESNGLLESCATVQYILKERKPVLSNADTKINSPYNTYRVKGLPIGPIASPGLVAIDAAISPAKTDYLYFVAGGDGRHYFAKTFNEHLNNTRKAGLN